MCIRSVWGKLQNSDEWIKELSKWRNTPRLETGWHSIVRFAQLIYRFNEITNQYPSKLFCGYWQADSKVYGEANVPEEPTQYWRRRK